MLLGTRRDPLFGNCWFDQYSGVARCKHPHHESAIRMSDQDVRSGHRGDFQQLMEFVSDASRRARHQTALAPAEPGAVVRTRARHAGDRWLHEAPTQGGGAERGVEDDGRSAVAGAVKVQTMCPDVDEPPWWPTTSLRPHLRRVPGANAISALRFSSSAQCCTRSICGAAD